MQILDNINHTVRDDLHQSVKRGSKLSIAAACFSIYAYQELKKQLEGIDELRFIFTSPTFTTDKTPKASASSTFRASAGSAVFTARSSRSSSATS